MPDSIRVQAAVEPLAILHVGEWLKAGVASYLHNILPQQVAAFGANRIALAGPAKYLQNVGAPDGVRLLPLRYDERRPLDLTRFVRQVDGLIRRENPGLVHLHSSFAGFAGRIGLPFRARRHRPKIVYCAHGWAFERESGAGSRRLFGLAERALAHVTDAIVNISQFEQDAAIRAGLPADRCHVILNGVADIPVPDVRKARADQELKLLFIGRFDKQKGIDLLLDAMRYLQDSPIRLYVAGESVLGGLRLQWPSNVVQLGWVAGQRLSEAFSSVDAVIVPSRWEGFGLVAIEAMRAGRAVIASRRGGLPEIVDDKVTGILFDLQGPRELAKLLSSLQRESLAEMGQHGRMRYEAEFTADRMSSLLCTLYQSVMVGDSPSVTAAALDATRNSWATQNRVVAN